MFASLSRLILNFRANEAGQMAVIWVLSLLPVLMLIGGALDFNRLSTEKIKVRSALDSAVLATAKFNLDNDAANVQELTDFLTANLAAQNVNVGDLVIQVAAESIRQETTVTATIEGSVNTTLLSLAGMDELNYLVTGQAMQGIQFTEVALVLDISSSMVGRKIEKLKPAAEDFVRTMLGNAEQQRLTAVSLIPFGGTVNIDPLFDRYVLEPDANNLDPIAADYDFEDIDTEDGFRFTTGDSCIEYNVDDFDTDDLPLESRGQLPDFWRYQSMDPYCPTIESAAMFNSNDVEEIADQIDGMTLSDGTGLEVGALWGLKALSPALRGELGGDYGARPADFNDPSTKKVMVIMADGIITPQYRPIDPFNPDTFDENNRVPLFFRGQLGQTTDSAISRFTNVCDQAKQNGIAVYTIGFHIDQGSLAEMLLQECASSAEHYYLVGGLDIDSAFRSIASSIGDLRLSQ